jgi:S1-C subfamily serine protease
MHQVQWFVVPLVVLSMAPAPWSGQSQLSGQTVASETFDSAQRTGGGTQVALEQTLTSLLATGGVPSSIEELRDLEKQAAKVAASAVACTVSVQIGPAQGCGVIVTESGYILTAAHVATRPGRTANITLSNGRRLRATTLGMNRHVDAGLMKIDPNQNGGVPWPHATLGKSENLKPGMWCVATGHPGGYEIGRGPVTRVGRILDVQEGSIKTDCALIGGDSGGPLFDISGRLIAIHSRIGNDVDENLHVPIDHFGSSWSRMQSGESWGYLEGFRPVLGLKGQPGDGPAVVERVHPGSAAEEAEFLPGDIVEQFGDIGITNFESLRTAVSNTMPGERLKVWVRRNGQSLRLSVEIGRADD